MDRVASEMVEFPVERLLSACLPISCLCGDWRDGQVRLSPGRMLVGASRGVDAGVAVYGNQRAGGEVLAAQPVIQEAGRHGGLIQRELGSVRRQRRYLVIEPLRYIQTSESIELADLVMVVRREVARYRRPRLAAATIEWCRRVSRERQAVDGLCGNKAGGVWLAAGKRLFSEEMPWSYAANEPARSLGALGNHVGVTRDDQIEAVGWLALLDE